MDLDLLNQFVGWILVLALWSVVWKGFALWRAARLEQKGWFVALLILNTAGILEIIYLLVTQDEMKEKATPKSQGGNR